MKSNYIFESKAMNYPGFQFTKHSLNFLMSYGYCEICATSAISDTNGMNTYQ